MSDENVTNYADDTTPYNIDINIESLIDHLNQDTTALLNWFDNNHFKLNPDKCKLLVTHRDKDVSLDVAGQTISCAKSLNSWEYILTIS